MTSLTVSKGMIFGLIVSFCAALCFFVLSLSFAVVPLLKPLVAACTLAYLAYLLKSADSAIGRWVTLCIWLLVTATVHYVSGSLVLFTITQLGFVWLIRSLYHHQTFLASVLDLVLCGTGFAAAIWAAHETHSLFLSLWSFFLIQALFVLIPNKTDKTNAPKTSDTFRTAQKVAESALRRLSINQTN